MLGRQRLGERRSRWFTMTYAEPWDVDVLRVQHNHYLRVYLERMAKQGWALERVLSRSVESVPTFDKERGALRVFNVDVLMSRPVRKFVVQVPDRVVPKLLAHPRIGPLITDVS